MWQRNVGGGISTILYSYSVTVQQTAWLISAWAEPRAKRIRAVMFRSPRQRTERKRIDWRAQGHALPTVTIRGIIQFMV